jgi:hypothetical protein
MHTSEKLEHRPQSTSWARGEKQLGSSAFARQKMTVRQNQKKKENLLLLIGLEVLVDHILE